MARLRAKLMPIGFGILLLVLQLVVAWPGIGRATYLADQLDQTGAFLQLLQGQLQFFYGPFMSGTNPPAHCFGPLGSVLFGLPTWLGANPDQIHGLFILLVSLSILVLFIELHQHDKVLAYLWSAAIFALPSFWWHHSMLWVNAVLLPIICLELSLFLRLFRRPSWTALLNVLAVFILGLHIHSSAIFGIGLVLMGAYVVRTKGPLEAQPRQWLVSCLLLFLAIAPYGIAELFSRGENFKAILANLQNFGSKHEEGWTAALMSTNKVYTALGLSITSGYEKWFAGGVLLASVAQVVRGAFRFSKSLTSMLWIIWAFTMFTQALFFYAMNRPLLSPHYTSFLIPFYVFPWVSLIQMVFAKLHLEDRVAPGLATAFVILAFVYFPKISESHEWNYRSIKLSLEAVCTEFGPIDTVEQVPFRAYDDSIDPLLKFLGKRYVPACRFSSESSVILVPALSSQPLSETLRKDERNFKLVKSVSPGIGIYQAY